MRKRQSKLLKTLRITEDLIFLFSDYFDKDKRKCPDLEDWLYAGVDSTVDYFVQKGVLNPNLSFKQKPKSVLKLIKKPWDSKWRFIVFDIPQEKTVIRNLIRRRLKEWDFKFFQRSIWFSPLPLTFQIKQLDKQIDDTDYLSIIEGEIYRNNPKKLVREKWNTSKWEKDALNWKERVTAENKISPDNQEYFWSLIANHPKVPLDLLPKNWPLEIIFRVFMNKKFQI